MKMNSGGDSLLLGVCCPSANSIFYDRGRTFDNYCNDFFSY